MHVYLSKIAQEKLLNLSKFLLEEWGKGVKDELIQKLTKKINQISNQPKCCPQSNELVGLYKCVLTKHNTFYYQVDFEKKEIEIITLFDTRQDPNKLRIG